MASLVLIAYYELVEFERPESVDKFEIWAFDLCKKIIRAERARAGREFNQRDILAASQFENQSETAALDRLILKQSGSVLHVEKARQEDHVMALDILRALGKSPTECQAAFRALFDYDTIVEFAKDKGLNLFDAMNEQRRLRDIVRRLLEDEADEKKFAEAAE